MKVYADFAALEKLAAAADLLADVPKSKSYINDLYDHAYDLALDDLNRQAAVLGATGAISHMFEWGTLGINRSRSNMRADPLSERARLWSTISSGSGFNRKVGFVFKPSVAVVPKPTVKRTGASSEVLGRLKDHTFTGKAAVMETGAEVTIARKDDTKALFVPLLKNRDYGWATDEEKRQGFAFRPGPFSVVPGKNVKGNFTTFFANYWDKRGPEVMEADMTKNIENDFQKELNTSPPKKMVPVRRHDSQRAIKNYKAQMKRAIENRARSRNV